MLTMIQLLFRTTIKLPLAFWMVKKGTDWLSEYTSIETDEHLLDYTRGLTADLRHAASNLAYRESP